MEFAFEEKTVSHLQLLAEEWLRQEETAELIVPDSEPDAAEVLDCFASCVVRSKECQAGSVLISGGIQASLLYLAGEETTPRLLETYLPFSIKKEISDCEVSDLAQLQCRVTHADGRVLNSRKLLVRVEIGCDLHLYRPAAETIYVPDASDPHLQLHRRQYPLLLDLEAGEKLFAMEEEPELPAGRPDPIRIVFARAQPSVTETRLAGSRMVCKGVVSLQVLYEAAEGQVTRWDCQLPFSQFIDLAGSYEEETCALQLQLAGCAVTLNGERRLSCDLMLLAQCMVRGYRTLEIVDDAYWLGGSMQAKVSPCSIRCQLDQQQLSQTVYLEVPAQMYLVHDAQVLVGRPEVSQRDGRTEIRVPVAVSLCGADAAGHLCGGTAQGAAEFSQAASNLSHCSCAAYVTGEVFATPGADRVQVRFDLTLQCQWHALCSFESISGGVVQAQEETPDRPSVILRTIERDTSVWDIAKACNTTQERLTKANELQEDVVPAGTLLLLPLA